MSDSQNIEVNGIELETSIPKDDLQVFAEAADTAGLTLREYSGRGMYGRQTLAATFHGDAEYGDLLAELPKPMRRRVKADSMGTAAVAYLYN